MSALTQLQRDFSAYVLHDRAGIAGLVSAGDGDAPVRQRVDVYRDGYRLRLIEVLDNDHPGLRQLAGADGFDALCRAYIDARPSTHFNIRWFGAGLATFLRTQAPWSQRPALTEMAALEWALTLAFDAVDEPPVALAEVAALTPEQWPSMRLRFAAALQRLDLGTNVGAIRRALDREETVPPAEVFDAPRAWVVWRRDRGVYQRALEADEAGALDAARLGSRFAELCDRLCEWHAEDQVALQAAGFLKHWIEQQWVTALTVGDDAG